MPEHMPEHHARAYAALDATDGRTDGLTENHQSTSAHPHVVNAREFKAKTATTTRVRTTVAAHSQVRGNDLPPDDEYVQTYEGR